VETLAFNIGKACLYGVYLFLTQLEDALSSRLDGEQVAGLEGAIIILRMILDPPVGVDYSELMRILGYGVMISIAVGIWQAVF